MLSTILKTKVVKNLFINFARQLLKREFCSRKLFQLAVVNIFQQRRNSLIQRLLQYSFQPLLQRQKLQHSNKHQ